MRSTIDRTPVGLQYVLPGAERVTDREVIERRMRQPLRSAARQDGPAGMFEPVEPEQQPLPLGKP